MVSVGLKFGGGGLHAFSFSKHSLHAMQCVSNSVQALCGGGLVSARGGEHAWSGAEARKAAYAEPSYR